MRKQVLEHEKGYSVLVGSNYMYACNPVYKICKPDGPVCEIVKEETEDDPKDTSCTQDGKWNLYSHANVVLDVLFNALAH